MWHFRSCTSTSGQLSCQLEINCAFKVYLKHQMDSEKLLEVLNSIQDRLTALELKSTKVGNDNSDNLGTPQCVPQPPIESQHGGAMEYDEPAGFEPSASPRLDIQREFESIKESLSKVLIPPHLKLQESSAGIKQDSKQILRVISKTARFAETGLRQLSLVIGRDKDKDGSLKLSEQEAQSLYTIFAAQQSFLQSEYSALVVKNSFDEETTRLYRQFENHTSAFNSTSLNNLRIAADLARDKVSSSTRRGNVNTRGGPFSFNRQHRFPRFGYYNNRGRGNQDWQSTRRPPTNNDDF